MPERTALLMRYHAGTCGCWACFMSDVLASQGVAPQAIIARAPAGLLGAAQMLVPDAQAEGDGGDPYHPASPIGLPPGAPTHQSMYNFHVLVETSAQPGHVYDASYGVDNLTEQAWEDNHLTGVGLINLSFWISWTPHVAGIPQLAWSAY